MESALLEAESGLPELAGRPAYTASAVVLAELTLVVAAWVTTATAGTMAAAVAAAGTGTMARLALAWVFLPLCHGHDAFVATNTIISNNLQRSS